MSTGGRKSAQQDDPDALADVQRWSAASLAADPPELPAVHRDVQRWCDAPPEEQLELEPAAMDAAQAAGRRSLTAVRLMGTLHWRTQPVMDKALETGKAFRYARQAGWKGLPEHFTFPSREDAHQVSSTILKQGLERFAARAVELRMWSPSAGQSVRTWYIRDCLRYLPNAFRAWRRNTPQLVPLLDVDAGFDSQELSYVDLTAQLSPELARLANLRSQGLSVTETAGVLGYSRATAYRRDTDLEEALNKLRYCHPDSTTSQPKGEANE